MLSRHRFRSPLLSLAAGLALAIMASPAMAHSGGMAADGCHRDKKAGERHWHIDGGSDRGGECIRRNGETVRMPPPAPEPATVTVRSDVYTALVAERDRLRGDLGEARRAAQTNAAMISDLERRLGQAETARGNALRDAAVIQREAERVKEAATRRVRIAQEDAAAAEARALGHGPAVSPRCIRGVHATLDKGRWGWGDEAKAALRRACLE